MLRYKKNIHSRIHIIWLALLIALIVKVGGYQGDVVNAMKNPVFWLWYAYAYFISFLILQLLYFLVLSKNFSAWKAILTTIGVFFLIEIITMFVFNYGDRSKRILYFTELPFGTAIIILIYVFLKKKNKASEDDLKIHTVNGISKLNADSILFVYLSFTHLHVVLRENKTLKVNKPLKYMIDLLDQYDHFYTLNRQYISSYQAITSFETEHDSRLKVNFVNGTCCYVSKNRASDFKKWFNTHSSL